MSFTTTATGASSGNTPSLEPRSPADVEDFVHGFLLTEGVIRDTAEVDSVTVTDRPEGVVAHARLHGALPGHLRRE
ncbi:formate dehydrogenase accessory sulfurtransferase FdhD, partial [Arhodomonas aquaeolei]|uniref:formate dehydrogenase accessory sulfurtransferase FdhD n=1 Tax=Arhodomonas aquaeolei TaxID=2369 RepID=UPI002166DBE8